MAQRNYTDFAPVTTGANGTIHNGLPLKNPATAFQYRKRMNSFISFGAFDTTVGTGFKTVTGSWTIQVKSPIGTVLFEQSVSASFMIIVQMVAGAIGFFFWYVVGFKTETTICDGKPVPVDANGHHQGWQFVDLPRPTQFSEDGPQADLRAGDFDDVTDDIRATGTFTYDGGYIDATFQSAAYNCTIPVGSTLNVITDKWQFAKLREATYSFSFKGGGKISALWDRVGAYRMARPGLAGTILEHRYPGSSSIYAVPQYRGFYEGVNNPCIAKTRDNALWILGNEATQGKLWLSEDDGTTKTRVTRKVDGREQELLVFGSGYEMIDLKVAPSSGTMWALAGKDSRLFVSSSRDDWNTVKELGPQKSPPYALGVAADETILVASAMHEFLYDGNLVQEKSLPTKG
ncbi:hypothetical protein IAD21_00567 [Abditibacteriota bacterium]|nr:hypothetical protein IAD21_00567 [Abditibacteriota bacterium]